METGQPDAGDTEIIDGTRTVTLTDLADNILSETVYDIASGLQLSSAITTEMDEFNRPIRVDYDDGTHTITNYGCCGIDSFTDRQGITTFYMHDELKRPSTVTRAGISTVTTYDAVGNILKTVERGTDNSPITLNTSTFDLAGRQTSSMNALNRITTFAETIDSNGHTVRTTTLPNDLTQIRTYAQDGSLLSISGTGAHPVNYEYGVEADGFFTKEIKVGPQGAATEWTKTYEDILGRPYKTLFPDGSFQISSYNSLGQLVKETDPDGVIRLYQYNGRGEQEYEAIDMNRNGVIDFAGTDRIRRIQDDATIAHGTIVRRSTITQWDKDNNANPVTVSVNETSADGLQQWITTDGLTTHIQTAYNGTGGRTVVTTSPDGTNTTEIFQDDVLTSSITQRNGVGTLSSLSYAYTPHNRLASITDARTGMTSFTYDKAGNLKTVTTPSPDGVLPSQITRYTYDIMGRVSLVTLPDGGIVQYTYTRTGELRTQSGARIYSAIYTYDPQGRLKTLKAGGSGITTWNYDPVRGFLISKKYANNNGTLYTYTSAGRLETRTWARGVTTTYSYNNAGDLLNVDYSDSTPDLNYIYNRRGRNIGVVSSLETVQLHYNKPGQLLKESHIGGPLAGVTVSNTYDSLFRRSALGLLNGSTSLASNSFTYDAASRLETVTSGSHSAAYTYWPNSSLVNTITFRNGSNIRLTTTKTFDKLNRLTSISSVPSADSARSFDYSYNSANQRYRVGLDDGSYWMYQYDNLGQVTSGRKYFSDDTPVPGQQFDYTFDDIGNRTSTTENGRIASYTANNLNQYTNRQAPGVVDIIGTADAAAVVTVNNQPTTRHGEYFYAQLNVDNSTSPVNLDVNIVTVLSGAGENGEDLVTEERYNVLLPASEESFAHNPDGNLIRDGLWKYRYDAENRLISIESPLNVPVEARRRVEYTRDYRNRLIERKGYVWSSGAWSLATQTKFVYDDVNLIAELDGIGDLMRSYVYGTDLSGRMQGAAGVGGLLYVSKYQPQISNHFVVNDGNGNVATLIDATTGKISGEYGYETFGKLLQESGSSAIENPLKFSTQYTDPFTDHILYQERANLPWIGRWLSRDPIGEQGGLNLYASCYNDCINFVDPLGLETFTATAVAKSYIATLGKQDRLIFGPEDRWDRLFLRQVTPSYARDAQELAEWLYGLDENPRSDSKDGQYRLFSKVKFIFDCKCGGKIDFKNTEGKGYTVEMDGGAEALWGLIRGTVNIDNLKIEKRGDAAYRFHWFTYGRPHFFAELSFQLIKFRRSVNIWHSVFGRIFCDGDKGYIEATLKGSSFPSHRLWLNGELKKTIHQGPLANLWKSRLPDPSFVQ
ncbi:MAG: hypothetical protein MRJ65_05940 [Candidatus Brocadiaceae bacterium]|nr:hypothetical protein [Candidatus Brocadiaceae bacterium]